MTHSEFNHLLGSINALSPEQMRQLRRELDSKLASPAFDGDRRSRRKNWPIRNAASAVCGRCAQRNQAAEAGCDWDRVFTPIPIQGEPLSETVIRERR